ncbi:MAG: ABC transporter permease [Gemmatimonadetes bacterium]|nr:ABC transporter permease [Gemmatimonadota bacterium]
MSDPRAPQVDRPARRALAIAAALVAASLVVPLLAPHAPDAIDLAARRAGPSVAHWMGTDDLGRDVLSRVLHGARLSLLVGLASAAVTLGLGVVVGVGAGWRGGALDTLLMRATDALLSMPRLPLLMVAAAILEPGAAALAVLVGATGWMETARVVRAEVLALRGRPFIDAVRASGAAEWRILARHLVPNAAPTIAVAATLAVGRGILLESALSFFGVGVRPPAPSWGNMLYQAQQSLTVAPWAALAPGACIFATVFVINSLGARIARGDLEARPA